LFPGTVISILLITFKTIKNQQLSIPDTKKSVCYLRSLFLGYDFYRNEAEKIEKKYNNFGGLNS